MPEPIFPTCECDGKWRWLELPWGRALHFVHAVGCKAVEVVRERARKRGSAPENQPNSR